jgi:hypothetical protein
MSKGSSRPATTTTSYNIPDFVQQNTQEVFDAARGFNPQVFQGQRFAAQNPFEQQQIAALGDFGQAGVDAYQNVVSGLLGQDIGNPQLLRDELNTPMGGQFLDQVITDRTADVVNNLTSQFSRAGRLGSDAFGGALGRGIGTAVAPLLQQQENLEAQRRARLAGDIIGAERAQAATQAAIAGLIPQAQDLQLQQLSALGTAGDLQRTADERSIAAAQAQIAEENAAEVARLNALLAAQGAGNIGIGTTTTQTQARQNPFGDALLGAGLLARSLITGGV